MSQPSTKTTEAAKLVNKLLGMSVTYEEIAVNLRVSANSVLRWRRGVKPHPGHLANLREYVEVVNRRKAKQAKS